MNAGSGTVDRGVIGSGGTNEPESGLGGAPPDKAPSTAVRFAAANHPSPVGGGSPILIDHENGHLVPSLKIGSSVFHDQAVVAAVEFNRRLAVHIGGVVLGPVSVGGLIDLGMVLGSAFVPPRTDEGVIGRGCGSRAVSKTGEDGGTVVGIQPKLEVGIASGGEVGRTEIDGSRAHRSDPSLESGGGTCGIEYGTIVHHG